MRTLSYPSWETLELGNTAVPTPGPGEVLVRVAACGICGSELETFATRNPRRTPPIVMGHEFCGTVEAICPDVTTTALGARVVSNSVVPCGTCVRCKRGDSNLCATRQVFGMHRPGAFAEFVVVPARVLLPWPDGLSAEAACLAEPLANGVHVVELVRHRAPKTALVIGAGPIGLMCQQALQSTLGVSVVVTDRIDERVATAARLGAHVAVGEDGDLEATIRDWTRGEGVDVVVDAVGSEATKRLSIELTRPGGAAVWIGLHGDTMSLDSYGVTLTEKTVFGSYAAHMNELGVALDLMASGQVDVTSWTHSFSLEDGVEAFQRMLKPQAADIKAVLIP